MTFDVFDPDFERRVRASFARQGLNESIGATLPGAAWQRSSANIGGGGIAPLVHLHRRERTLAA